MELYGPRSRHDTQLSDGRAHRSMELRHAASRLLRQVQWYPECAVSGRALSVRPSCCGQLLAPAVSHEANRSCSARSERPIETVAAPSLEVSFEVVI
jgi:hypothetical protein